MKQDIKTDGVEYWERKRINNCKCKGLDGSGFIRHICRKEFRY